MVVKFVVGLLEIQGERVLLLKISALSCDKKYTFDNCIVWERCMEVVFPLQELFDNFKKSG